MILSAKKTTNHPKNKLYDKSALQIARAAYKPKMPEGLNGNVKIEEGADHRIGTRPERNSTTFPHTYGMPIS